ncbi:MAG: acyl-ACP--UDP-N-acetylglucosamine O-acyltransferase [Verrucomicrobia bacterium]|nr:acyl-ACP--UDP-N-acetylglucosamine O-acyltransferase [Verrucomicrobiota bacterium]MCG2679235.1 acyl-ACP--UDP-N-acetylglucosamine O-acyltransferase [Kiritimatiellia bacterium]MBU4248629.1 acyl-ACP--UDP-N-acetylglucosamine O-acyltransferase [Verrucomicrobiota bacterium]MBU4290090.1 acyl-ACP--UDP-N-acetylglucosamine O-acyltransferase [Verrucomicrobiota bacterium]MBU4429788.1 acyl-ACP--UDP-N-acetylglucosamine O-acyltransferase [Verrucomicrobiota bacterium]
MTTIHPTAIVHPGANLGNNVQIGPYAVIEDKVCIGDGTVMGPHVTICRFTTLGAACTIHANAVLGDWPQDVAFKPEEESFLRIGSHCMIREGVTMHRGTKPGTATEVGDHCFLMVNSHLGHNVKLGASVIIANGALLGGYVDVGDGVFISGNCLVHQFTRIGKLAILAGGTAINKDVPPFCKTQGLSPNTVAGLNVIGLKRAGIGLEDRLAIKRAFAILYRSGLNVSQAVERMKREYPSGLAQEFCVFIEASKRGICRCRGVSEKNADDE